MREGPQRGDRAPRIDWSARGRARVYLWTLIGTLVCIGIVVAVDLPNLTTLHGSNLIRTQIVDIVLPIALTAPAMLLLLNKIRQLAIAQHQLSIFATTDSLTGVLNRGAFIGLVEGALTTSRRRAAIARGALLIVDADHFKLVNDRFGHGGGDDALRLIANALTSALRQGDTVGRVGGEEFGIFLPGADERQAARIAERVRETVAAADFRPEGEPYPLTVSVGGAMFAGPVAFTDLYRIADRRLYAAKEAGRNRVELTAAAALAA